MTEQLQDNDETQGTEASETSEATESTKDTGPTVIAAVNPTAEEMAELTKNIQANYNFSVDVKPILFRFKKTKDKDTGIETVREAVELAVPVPSVEGIIDIIKEGGKQLELLQDAVESIVIQVARDIISEDVNINAANFPVEKLSWAAISEMPKAQRRGGGIPKEGWDGFEQDYLEVMVPATGKSVEQITNAAKILKNRLAQVKTNKPILNLLVQQLAIYAEHSPNLEEYKECVEFLLTKADAFINMSEEDLLANL